MIIKPKKYQRFQGCNLYQKIRSFSKTSKISLPLRNKMIEITTKKKLERIEEELNIWLNELIEMIERLAPTLIH